MSTKGFSSGTNATKPFRFQVAWLLHKGFDEAGTNPECKPHLVAWATIAKPLLKGGLGIRPMHELNSGSMAKLEWRLLREPLSIWARVLYSKYDKGRQGTDIFLACRNPSNSWRGITESSPILQNGIQHSIGDVVELTTRPLPSPVHHRVVSDYWEPDSGWQWVELRDLLPANTLQRIASFQVYPDAGIEDTILWGKMNSGEFSIQPAIDILRDEELGEDQDKWSAIWKVKAPQKMKFLLWVVMHGALMTNENKVRRGFASNPNSLICSELVEDATHIFRTCKEAKEVWHYFERTNPGV
ncbi:hypothetical protein Cgig2_015818 [Carnegiea gigantea]|uniref:Reverse transcriptase zinc-binding domain-containing protein n=1 Tax=Carnegiea gigantea TaxID=171969 RepID=A0A9Q1QID9_9CARY|nr:hypothetical protein Cgig2_015818 [Carnegiea gigantea]